MGKVTLVPNLSCLFSAGTIGAHHGARDEHLSTRFSPKMVSTRNRVGVNKQADAGPSGPASITLDLATILDSQAKMQQELAYLKKCNADEMEALRQENSRLKQKIEAEPTLKGKAKEASETTRSLAFQPTKEESEYNPTPHTFTTTQQTPIPSIHPAHFPSTQPGHTVALPLLLPSPLPRFPTIYPSRYTLHMFHPTTHSIFRQPTSPLRTLPPPSPL